MRRVEMLQAVLELAADRAARPPSSSSSSGVPRSSSSSLLLGFWSGLAWKLRIFRSRASILAMVRAMVISNDSTELSRRFRKFTFIMPMRNRSRSAWVKGSRPERRDTRACIRLHVARGVEQREFVALDLVVQLVVGQEPALEVDLREHGDGLLAFGETAELRDAARGSSAGCACANARWSVRPAV